MSKPTTDDELVKRAIEVLMDLIDRYLYSQERAKRDDECSGGSSHDRQQ